MTKITNTAQLSAQTHKYARRSAETLRRRYYLGDLAQMSCSQSPQPFASFGGWLAGAPAFFWLANHTSQATADNEFAPQKWLALELAVTNGTVAYRGTGN